MVLRPNARCTHYDLLIINSQKIIFVSFLFGLVSHRPCCSAELRGVVAGSLAVPMSSSTNDRVGLVDNARKRGSETVQFMPSDSHCPKKPHTSTVLQEGPVVTLSGSSSHKLYIHSNEEAIEFPPGVVNVFPPSNDQSRCCCPTQPQRATLASCDVAQVFLSQYGADNLAYLQEKERREFPSKSPTSNRASETSSAPSMLSSAPQTSKENEITNKLAGYLSPQPGELSDAKFLPQTETVASAKFLEKIKDHLPKQPWVTARMRATVVCWLVEVTVVLNISDEAFHVAISILDSVFRSGATTEQYQANPDFNWDADFFCVKICDIQALGWYVFAFEEQGFSPCLD